MFENHLNRRRFQKATAQAQPDEIVCAVLIDGRPEYFVAPRDASDADVRATAFRLRHGRDMSTLEKKLLDIAEARRGS